MPSPTSKHVIEDIQYTRQTDSLTVPMRCKCGWTGRADEFRQHRADMGEKPAHGSNIRGTGILWKD